MQLAIWLPIAAGVLAGLAPITQGGLRRIDEKRFARYARQRRLPLPVQLRGPVLQRISRRERRAMTGGGIGLVLGLVAALVLNQVLPGSKGSLGALLLCGVAFGGSLGGFLAVLRGPAPLSVDAPRVARPVQTEVADYQTRGERVAGALAPVVILLALATAWTIWALAPNRPSNHLPLMGVATAVSVLLLIGWASMMVAARVLVRRPQRARDDLELAWDDADRCDALRGLSDNAIAAGMLACFVSLLAAGALVISPGSRAGAEGVTMILGLIAFGVGVLCWAMLLVPYLSGRFTTNPSLGLWSGRRFSGADSC